MNDAERLERIERENEALAREVADLRRQLTARGSEADRADLGAAHLELQRQERRLRLIVDGVRDHAITMLDPEGRVQTFNAPAERIKGYTLDEVRGKSFAMFFTDEDRAARLPEKELEVAREHGRYEGDGWRRRKDGSQFYAAVSLSALRDPSGALVGFVKVTQDRTRQRELSEALQQREEQLRLILDGVRDHAISLLDPDGRIRTFNAPAERIKGYPLDEVRGQYFGLFFTAEDRAAGLPETELQVARTRGRYEGDGWRQRKDGSQFYAAVSLSALHDASGALVGFVKVTQDRTRQRELGEALARRESELRLILDAIPGLVAYLDTDRRYRLINRTYEEWFGTPIDEIAGKRMAEVLGDAAYDAIRAHVDAALDGHSTTFEAEIPYRAGGKRWIRATYIPDRGADGRVHGYVSLVLDITEAKHAQQQIADEARINEALYRVGTALAVDFDLDTIVTRLTEEATALCRAQFGAFFYNVADADGGSYMLYALAGAPRSAFERFPMPRNTQVFGPTFAGEGPVRSDDITEDPRYGKNAPYAGMPEGHLPVRSYLAVPVVSRTGEVLGGLFFGHAGRGVFQARDERLLVAVAAQAAIAIDNARLHAATVAAEENYRTLAEFSPQFVWTTTPDGVPTYYNQRYLDYLGLPLEQLRTASWERIVHPDDVERVGATWSAAIAAGERYESEYRLKRGVDGSYRWFLARGTPVRDGGGRLVRWVGTSTDIDERKRTEEVNRFLARAGTLLASSLDYRTTLPALASLAVPQMADWCAIDLLGGEGDELERIAVTHGDPAQLELLHELARRYPGAGAASNQRILSSGSSEHVREVTDAMLVASAQDSHHLELLRELGLRSWMAVPVLVHNRTLGIISFASAVSGRVLEKADVETAEEIGRRVGVMLDNARLFELTQRERRRAEEASRAKDELLSMTSHELRTPLNAILGWSRMLRAGALSPEKQGRALETIERNAKVQVQLVEDLLDFSRVVGGRLRLALASVEPAQVVEDAIDAIRPAADAKNVRLQILLDPDAGTLSGDAGRLQQVVWNLLSNAVKFTPKGGRVYVRMQREDSSVEIVVSDSGAGIEPAFLPHVFQAFRQQDATITRTHGGLGLGLAIVKHLVELHGGTIEARSEGLGSGATFIVRLPVSPLRPSSQASAGEATPRVMRSGAEFHCPPELEGLRVLVCEDEPDARELIEAVLTACGARVVTAGSVVEAMDRFRRAAPDFLISDIGMPETSGYELIRQVRALSPEEGGRVPAIALTAYASLPDRTRALMEGFQNHVSKPTEPQELVAAIAALVGRLAPS